MNQLDAADLDQLFRVIDALLISVGFSGLMLGSLIGWSLRRRYEVWKWFKTGIYCDECAPLVHPSMDAPKDSEG